MPKNKDRSNKFDKLRQQAEKLLRKKPDDGDEGDMDILELIRELKTHQTELNIQNQELQRSQQEMNLITDTIVASSRLGSIDEMCQMIGKTIHDLNQQAYVITSFYDSQLDAVRARSLHGFHKNIDRIFEMLGGNLFQFKFRPSEMGAVAKLFTTGKLERVPGGIYTLLEKKVPKAVCRTIEKMVNIEAAYTVGFALEDEPKGGITLLTQKGSDIQNKAMIETFLNKSWIDFWKGEDHEKAKSAINKTLDGGIGYFEGYCPTAKGAHRWW
ncbi:MAG: hypothetical protein GF421_07505, partial [Candidatus Aminicenantes bacterium]|nr:hypothetical protein [Candidatus Aminicenantes bacterium]